MQDAAAMYEAIAPGSVTLALSEVIAAAESQGYRGVICIAGSSLRQRVFCHFINIFFAFELMVDNISKVL